MTISASTSASHGDYLRRLRPRLPLRLRLAIALLLLMSRLFFFWLPSGTEEGSLICREVQSLNRKVG